MKISKFYIKAILRNVENVEIFDLNYIETDSTALYCRLIRMFERECKVEEMTLTIACTENFIEKLFNGINTGQGSAQLNRIGIGKRNVTIE